MRLTNTLAIIILVMFFVFSILINKLREKHNNPFDSN